MGRAVVRGHALVLTLLLVPALAACSGDLELVSDADDLDAAVALWSDPWVAPTSATVAGPSLGSDGLVDRTVARRETSYAVGVRAAARSELRLALEQGWAATSSTCADTVQVAFVGPDEDALAQLVVEPDGAGATASLQVAARHHLDSSWKAPDAADGTCLDGGSAQSFVPPPLVGEAIGSVGEDRDAEWQTSDPAKDFIDVVNDDPALQALGLTVAVPRLDEGTSRRQAPAAEAETDAGSLHELAGQLSGWRLTFAACGGGGPVRATFVQDIADGHAVLGADVGPEGARVRVTVPMTEGPTGEWLDGIQVLDPSACMSSDAPRRVEAYGTPAVLPTALTPIAD